MTRFPNFQFCKSRFNGYILSQNWSGFWAYFHPLNSGYYRVIEGGLVQSEKRITQYCNISISKNINGRFSSDWKMK